MKTIKSTIQLVFLPGFRVAPMCPYFNMLPLARLETRQKSIALLADFKIFIALMFGLSPVRPGTKVDFQGHLEGRNIFHNLLCHVHELVFFPVRGFKNYFIMYG